MAKYHITRVCGHEEDIQIYGPTKDRDGKAEWEEGRLCYDCYQAKLAADQLRKNEEAAKEAETKKRPELSGSEKQIAWAITIREKALTEMEKILTRLHNNTAEKAKPEHREMVAKLRQPLIEMVGAEIKAALEQTEARFWIDNRDKDFGSEITAKAREIEKNIS